MKPVLLWLPATVPLIIMPEYTRSPGRDSCGDVGELRRPGHRAAAGRRASNGPNRPFSAAPALRSPGAPGLPRRMNGEG